MSLDREASDFVAPQCIASPRVAPHRNAARCSAPPHNATQRLATKWWDHEASDIATLCTIPLFLGMLMIWAKVLA
jgi:hypothetical protein